MLTPLSIDTIARPPLLCHNCHKFPSAAHTRSGKTAQNCGFIAIILPVSPATGIYINQHRRTPLRCAWRSCGLGFPAVPAFN
ncbi:hypothetical protein [Conchiformibius steedae]|uniref:hypothetical protein n=1 Tax=Conchiformibius steedae TaxID=153493 RepID=UPI0026F28DDE|nr:hypothetical protein [Conchiformibius steedae]